MVSLYNNKDILDDNIIIIGRKYFNRHNNNKIYNSIGLYCVHQTYLTMSRQKKILRQKNTYKQSFLANLQNVIQGEFNLERSLFLDVEYVNDLYDDFSTFPISTLIFLKLFL